MATFKTITRDEFVEIYKPIPNHIVSANGFDFGKGCCLYETYGDEIDYVLSQIETKHRYIWTVVDCDGELVIVSGVAFVNRMGYIFTEVPVDSEEHITVEDDD